MKPILIDKISSDTQSGEVVRIGSDYYEWWTIAKPLNYNYGFFTRLGHAIKVLRGKAIAVRFFSDLSDEEKREHLLNEFKKIK
jgi:hypothetical protein